MALLAKRVRTGKYSRGGAGPFHAPQKQGRVNHFGAPRWLEEMAAKPSRPVEPIELARVRARDAAAAGAVQRILDRLKFRRAA